MTDKTVSELMALAERFAYHSALINETHIETRTALEQAIRRAVDFEPVAEVHQGLHNGTRWIKALGGVNIQDLPVGPLYARNKAAKQEPLTGWKLVPVEPTPEMLTAAGPMANYDFHARGASPDYDHVEWWRAMLAAAPSPGSGT